MSSIDVNIISPTEEYAGRLKEKKKQIEEMRPLIHCITNTVTVNDCANVLLALGASPTMAHHPGEVAEMAENCGALVLNMGATECLDAMKVAGLAAKRTGRPVVLDPVGAAGTEFRRKQTIQLIETVKPDCIRGNLSELRALALETMVCRGVDAREDEVPDPELLLAYAKKTGAFIVASGATDHVAVPEAGGKIYGVTGGSPMMARVTGTGCMSSVLLGAFLAVERTTESILECLEFTSLCAKRAEGKTKSQNGGTMQFRMNYIDEIYLF